MRDSGVDDRRAALPAFGHQPFQVAHIRAPGDVAELSNLGQEPALVIAGAWLTVNVKACTASAPAMPSPTDAWQRCCVKIARAWATRTAWRRWLLSWI